MKISFGPSVWFLSLIFIPWLSAQAELPGNFVVPNNYFQNNSPGNYSQPSSAFPQGQNNLNTNLNPAVNANLSSPSSRQYGVPINDSPYQIPLGSSVSQPANSQNNLPNNTYGSLQYARPQFQPQVISAPVASNQGVMTQSASTVLPVNTTSSQPVADSSVANSFANPSPVQVIQAGTTQTTVDSSNASFPISTVQSVNSTSVALPLAVPDESSVARTQSGSLQEAEMQLEFMKISQSKPKTANEYYQRGLSKYKLKDYSGGLSDLDRAIELDASFGQAYLYRGRCKKALKDKTGAAGDFQKSLELNPESANYYIQSGSSKVQARAYKSAVEDFNKAINLNSASSGAYIKRGEAKALAGDYKAAILDYNQALQLEPQSGEAYSKKAYAQFKLRNYAQAGKDNEMAKQLFEQQGDFEGYKHSVDSINTLREVSRKK